MDLMKRDLIMTSREVAGITGKEHKHVMRDIREELENLEKEEINTETIFGLSEYKDSTGRNLPMYTMGREGAMQIATRYSAVIRRKLILRLDELEKGDFKIPKNLKDALYLAYQQQEEIEKLELKLVDKENDITRKNQLIDVMTENYDGTFIRVLCHDYITRLAFEKGKFPQELYTNIYTVLGRSMKKDIYGAHEKFLQNERDIVHENINYNKDNNLKGESRKSPFKLKDSRYNISKIEYICDVLGEGRKLIEIMSKVLEIGIEEIIEKYNVLAI